MPHRSKHPQKEIEDAIKYAEDHGWSYKPSGHSAHACARMLCPLRTTEGCQMSIWSTPRSASQHARQITRRVQQCTHSEELHHE